MEESRDVAISGLLRLSALWEFCGRLGSSASVGLAAQRPFSANVGLCAAATQSGALVFKASCPKWTLWIVTLERKAINEPRRQSAGSELARDIIPESAADIDLRVRRA